MGTTPINGLPYPEGTDAVANGASAIQSLAAAIDSKLRIIQVVQGTTTAVIGNTTAGYTDTALSATITPRSTTNKILVVVSQNCYTTGSITGMGWRLLRGATVLDTLLDLVYGTNSGLLAHETMTYLDSPATTSAITYKTQFNRNTGGGIVYVQPNANRSSMLLFEVAA